MGFRTDPLTSAEGVDTGTTPTGPGVRIYQATAAPPFSDERGVVEFSDGQLGSDPSTITRTVHVYDDGSGFPPQVVGGSFVIDGGSVYGVPMGVLRFSVDEGAFGGYKSSLRVDVDELNVGPVAKLRQTTASGTLATGYQTLTWQAAGVEDPYAGWGGFRTPAQPTRWYVPAGEGGRYAVEGRVAIATVNAGSSGTCRLLLNGTAVLGSVGDILTQPTPANSQTPSTGRIVFPRLEPGEYLELQGFCQNTWNTRVTADGVASSLLVERIG